MLETLGSLPAHSRQARPLLPGQQRWSGSPEGLQCARCGRGPDLPGLPLLLPSHVGGRWDELHVVAPPLVINVRTESNWVLI